jgi:hypothetical protein
MTHAAPRVLEPPDRFERWLFAGLCAALVAYWALQYHPFVLPNNDYPTFERTAESLAALELPKDFQRMPVFPALMGVLAPLVPARHPYLHAALALNLAFAFATLVLLFRLAARTYGRGAILTPLLFASATQLHSMALQPLVEPSLGFFVVLAFVLLQARSPWQYAAAAAAALSRYEAAMLIPVLFACNAVAERRLWRHALLAALASAGVLTWTALGALHGSGGTSYFDLMQGMAFRPATDFFERSFKEPFRGWYRESPGGLALFAAVIGVPVAAGLRAGAREFPREAAALAGFFAVCVATIVVFGINKARYVYPTEWIPLFFFAAGLVRLCEAGARRLAAAPWALAAGAALAAFAAWLFLGRRWALHLATTRGAQPAALDLAFAAFLVACAALWLAHAGLARRPRLPWAACALAALVVLTPELAGGIHAKRKEMWKVYYWNWPSYVAGRWLEEHLAPEERATAVSPTHVRHATGLATEQVVGFAALRAETPDDLAAELRTRGIRYVVYTWRKTNETPSDVYYDKKLKAYLGEPFRAGGPVPGFAHVATVPLPPQLERDPVQVYRVLPERGG